MAGATTVTPAPIAVASVGAQAGAGLPDSPPPHRLQRRCRPASRGVDTSGVACAQVAPSTSISPTLAGGTYTLAPAVASVPPSAGPMPADYTATYTTTSGNLNRDTAAPAPATAHRGRVLARGLRRWDLHLRLGQFYGSTGPESAASGGGHHPHRRPGRYWLVASDGGIFAFGEAGFYGSIPGSASARRSGSPHSLERADRRHGAVGRWRRATSWWPLTAASSPSVTPGSPARARVSAVASGRPWPSCPMPPGNGYWLVTQTANVYTFGDAPYYGAPGTPQGRR